MSDYGRIAHEAYEEAAAKAGWETNPASRVPWEDVPLENRVATTAAANAVADAVLHEAAVTPPKRVDSTDPLIHQNANGTVTLEWRDDRTATLVSREFLDDMVQAHNAVNKGTITNPASAWCRGYDVGLTIGTDIGQGRERAAIVAWLRERHIGVGAWAAADDIEQGDHLRSSRKHRRWGDDELDSERTTPGTVTLGAGWVPGSATQVEPDSSRSKWGSDDDE